MANVILKNKDGTSITYNGVSAIILQGQDGNNKVFYEDAELITDPTLTIEGMAADAKAAGDALRAHSSSFATVETTNTASQNYVVGQFLMLNDVLYKVQQAIAQGETLVVGTNIAAAPVGDQLEGLDAKLKFVKSAGGGLSVTLSVPDGCRCLLAVLGFGNINSIFAVFKSSNATPKVTKIGGGSSITMTAGSGTITVDNAETGNGMHIYGIALSGNLPS